MAGRALPLAVILAITLLTAASIASPRTLPSSSAATSGELLVATTPFDMDVDFDGDVIYWSEQPDEFCTQPGEVKAYLSSASSPYTVYSAGLCAAVPGSLVGTTDHSVRWFNGANNHIGSSTAPWDGSGTVDMATGVAADHLAADVSHLYFADGSTIKRLPLSAVESSPATVATSAGEVVSDLVVDSSHVYWSTNTGVYRAPVEGGPREDVLQSGSSNIAALAIDEVHVYSLAKTGAAIARSSKSGGGTVIFALPTAGRIGADIGLSDTGVYWLDNTDVSGTGRLRRAAKDLSSGPADISLGLNAAVTLDLSSSHVIWADFDGIWRLPLAAPLVAPDLTLSQIEVTQGLQNFANDVPLVEGKETFVRVYPATELATVNNATAQLSGTRTTGSSNCPSTGALGTIAPIDDSILVLLTGSRRNNVHTSFTFWLPVEWRCGVVMLTATIDPANAIPETNNGNNTLSIAGVTFNNKWPRCIQMFGAWIEGIGTYPWGTDTMWEMLDWMEAAYPVDRLGVVNGGRLEDKSWFETVIDPFSQPVDLSEILDELAFEDFLDNEPDSCDDDRFQHAMIPPSADTGSSVGLGQRPGDAATSKMLTDDRSTGRIWYRPFAASIGAHELAHNFGRRHVVSPTPPLPAFMGCGTPSNTDSRYPYNLMGPSGETTYWGFHPLYQVPIDPALTADLMTYCDPAWFSDYTYRALFNGVPNQSGGGLAAFTTTAAAGPHVIVTGALDDLGRGALELGVGLPEGTLPTARLDELIAGVPAGPYVARLVDSSNATLTEQNFSPLVYEDLPTSALKNFFVFLPLVPSAHEVVLLRGSVELDRLMISASPPSVHVEFPNGGEVLGDPLEVKWTAADSDGDPLMYYVHYSPDGGATWHLLTDGTFGTSLLLDDSGVIPGSNNALVRVTATDGFRATSDVSDETFSLVDRAPEAHVSRPIHGSTYRPDERIILSGRGLDAEDEFVADESLQWRVDGVVVGNGRRVLVGPLAPGLHLAQLTVTDSSLNSTTDSAAFIVGDCAPPAGNLSHNCFTSLTPLWHIESVASIDGMSSPMLAFNTGCQGQGVFGCTYATGIVESGRAATYSFAPLSGAVLTFTTARGVEPSACGAFDRTFVEYSTDFGASYLRLNLGAGIIEPGGQSFGAAQGEICGVSLVAQRVTVGLPDGTTNIAFVFNTVDPVSNGFAGQFIDDVTLICPGDLNLDGDCADLPPLIADSDFDGFSNDADNCPSVPNPQLNTDELGWAPDTLGNACDDDDDGDGCPDVRELAKTPETGGGRDPLDIWDFFDLTDDSRIDLSDTLAILTKFGLAPHDQGYEVRFDRYAPNPLTPWRTAQAVEENGIDLTDALVNLASFGHDCTAN